MEPKVFLGMGDVVKGEPTVGMGAELTWWPGIRLVGVGWQWHYIFSWKEPILMEEGLSWDALTYVKVLGIGEKQGVCPRCGVSDSNQSLTQNPGNIARSWGKWGLEAKMERI